MAVTHADLEVGRRCGWLGSKSGTAVIILCLFSGLLGFMFCLLAEFTRSEATWLLVPMRGGEKVFKCAYSGNGRIAFLCGVGASLTLAIALFVLHAYMWLAIHIKSQRHESPLSVLWDGNSTLKSKQASALFLTAWVCFGVAEVLLIIGLVVESLHAKRWHEPRDRCLVMRHWLFLAAGISDLLSVVSATSFYALILKIKQARDGELVVRREVMEAYVFSSTTQLSGTHPLPNSSFAEGAEEIREISAVKTPESQ